MAVVNVPAAGVDAPTVALLIVPLGIVTAPVADKVVNAPDAGVVAPMVTPLIVPVVNVTVLDAVSVVNARSRSAATYAPLIVDPLIVTPSASTVDVTGRYLVPRSSRLAPRSPVPRRSSLPCPAIDIDRSDAPRLLQVTVDAALNSRWHPASQPWSSEWFRGL